MLVTYLHVRICVFFLQYMVNKYEYDKQLA